MKGNLVLKLLKKMESDYGTNLGWILNGHNMDVRKESRRINNNNELFFFFFW